MKYLGIICVLFISIYQAESGIVGVNKCTWGTSYVCKDIATANSCEMVQQCRELYWKKPINDDEVCEICKAGMELVNKYLNENQTKPEIKSALLKICADIPITSLQSECNALVESDFETIYDELLLLLADGNVVCSAMGLCTSVEQKAELIYIMQNHISSMVKEAYENNQLPSSVPVIIDDTLTVENSYCAHCHAFVGDVQRMIMNNPSTVKQWENLIKMECKNLTPELIEVCQSTLGGSTDSILRSLQSVKCEAALSQASSTILDVLSSTNVDTVCNTIDMCSAGNMVIKESNDMCTDCKNFFEDWQEMIKNNKSIVESITKLVITECKELKGLESLHELVAKIAAFYCLQKPIDLQKECVHYLSIVIENNLKRMLHECENLASKYLSSLWQLIAETSPEETCTAIYFCDEKVEYNLEETSNSLAINEEMTSFLDSCSVCEEIVKVLDKELEQNSTEAEIKALLEEICGVVPASFKSDCDALVDEYSPKIIDLLVNGLAPEKLCAELKLCTSSKMTSFLDTCLVCEEIVKVLDKELEQNSTEAEIKALLEEVCGVVPASFKSDCDALVDEYSPKIIDLLVNGLAPEKLCAELKLCTSSKMTSFLDTCLVCEEIVKVLDKKLEQNSTEAEIKALLEEVCGVVPASFKSDCDALVDEYSPKIIDLLVNGLAPEKLCTELKLCTSSKVKDENTYCVDCTNFMKDLQNIARNNQSIVDDLTNLIEEQCDQLGPGLSELCQNQISTVVKNLLPDFIKLDVNTICTTILMCTNAKASKPLQLKAKDDDVCTHCTKFFQDWQEIIQNNQSTIDQLNSLIAEQCNNLGPDFEKLENLGMKYINLYCNQLPFLRSECKQKLGDLLTELINSSDKICDAFVKDYLPQLWNLIAENDAEEICSTLYFCDFVENVVENSQSIAIEEKIETSVDETVSCELCKVVLDEVYNLLEGNASKAAIENALEKVCSVLPADISGECKTFVSTYGDEVIDLIINEVESADICSKLKLCSSKETSVKVSNPVTCVLCKAVIAELDKLIEGNKTAAAIENALNEVCSLMPAEFSNDCKFFVNKYGGTVINLIINEVESGVICSQLLLCSSRQPVMTKLADDCALCTEIVGVLENLITENSTESEIEAALDKVCGLLPSALKSECVDLVNEYTPLIIQLLTNDITPAQLCAKLGLCPSAKYVKEDVDCLLCKSVVSELDGMLSKNSTETEIINAVESICNDFPTTIKTQCVSFIKDNGDALIKLLLQQVSPDKLCTELSLCKSVSLHTKDSIECDACLYIFKELSSVLTANSTEQEVIKELESYCEKISGSLKETCDDLAEEYVPEIMKLLANIDDPAYVCLHLKLCPQEKKQFGGNPCVLGPSYWCRNKQTASECNALSHCINHVWD